MNVLIVDDELNARENLRQKLKKVDPSLDIIGEAKNVKEAHHYITNFDVDLVFLDIEMPAESGFNLLEKISYIDFEIIFVTAYNEYALKAFEHLALAYITKPIDNDLLTKAYNKARNLVNTNKDQEVLSKLTGIIDRVSQFSKLAIPIESGLQMIEIDSIVSLEADEGYVIFELEGDSKIISSKRLSYFEQQLNNKHFIRIHRSYIVNKSYIESYHKVGFVRLSTNKELPVSKSYRSEVRRLLKSP